MFNSPFDIFTVKEKVGIGTDNPSERLEIKGNIKLNSGVAVSEFSSDGTLAIVNDRSVPTTQSVKTYVDKQISTTNAAFASNINTQIATVNTTLANKANKGGSSTQDFQANNLKVQGNFEVTGTTTFRNIEQHEGDVELGNEDSDRVKIHGVLESSNSSGALQITSPINITSTLTAKGNATLNSTFLGDVGYGANWAGFSHKNSVSLTSYALLQSNDGIYTLLNKKSGGGLIGFRVDNVDKMVINDLGNVGIGTTTPNDRFDVAGNIRVLTNSNPIRFTSSWSGFPDSTTNQAEICNDTGTYKTLMIVGNHSAGLGRRVSIWDRLEVNGITKTQKLALGDKWLLSGVGDAHASDEWLRLFNNQGTGYFGGLAAEKLWSSTGTVSSDIRLKRDIIELTQPLTKLLQLRGVSYYWQDVRKGTTAQLGLIAQEVETVFPELVEQGADGMKALNYNGLIPVLLEALKEQQSTIATLIDRLNILEAKQA
jgi:Chaperone of endosialidase